MEKQLRSSLIFHGTIVILLGMLAGFPYAFVVMGNMEGDPRAWRMAHLEGVLNGLLCLGAAGVFRWLSLRPAQQRLMTWSFVVMAYGNVVASMVGAWTGQRGLEFAAPVSNMIVFTIFMLAVVAVFVGLVLLAYGARPGANGGGNDVQVEVKAAASSSASRARGASPSRKVDVEVSVSKPGERPASKDGDDEHPDDGDRPMSRAERRRSKKPG